MSILAGKASSFIAEIAFSVDCEVYDLSPEKIVNTKMVDQIKVIRHIYTIFPPDKVVSRGQSGLGPNWLTKSPDLSVWDYLCLKPSRLSRGHQVILVTKSQPALHAHLFEALCSLFDVVWEFKELGTSLDVLLMDQNYEVHRQQFLDKSKE
ncbi:hypothetical protein TNCV_2516231 [Trichonephila clavipes]|nr:hypothetical protein TNCV_2516231 [Trichonephila clavipes]